MKVVNIFGSPGSGKSTTRSGIFYKMKIQHYNVEDVCEFAKDLTWEGHTNILQDQLYILAKQNRRLLRLENKVDYVISDSPILLNCAYIDMNTISYAQSIYHTSIDVFNYYDNINIWLNRAHQYKQVGRFQDEQQSEELSIKIKNILIENHIDFIEVSSDNVNIDDLINYIVEQSGK